MHESIENTERLLVLYENLGFLYNLWDKPKLRNKYYDLASEVAIEIDYENNQENINKFIYQYEWVD